MSCCEGSYGKCAPRNFWTKDEKMEMLTEYKDSLEKETQAVKERIENLKEK